MQKAPEKIYNWQNSQFSIARFSGGMKFNGHDYIIDYSDKEMPLVRLDVMAAPVVAAAGKAIEAKTDEEKQSIRNMWDAFKADDVPKV